MKTVHLTVFPVLTMLLLCALFSTSSGQGFFEEAIADQNTPADESTTQNGALSGQQARTDWNGYIRGDCFVGNSTEDADSEIKELYSEVALQLLYRKPPFGDAFAELRFKTKAENDSWLVDTHVREAYINLYLGPVDIRFGHQIISWGRADGINPTDNLTPRDLSIFSADADDRRLANFALRTNFYVSAYRFEFVWLPVYAESTFPTFSLPSALHFGEPDYPDTSISNGSFALRFHLQLPTFDGSLSYIEGYSLFPVLEVQQIDIIPFISTDITLGLTTLRQKVLGLDFSTALGNSIGLRGEAAYREFDEHEEMDHVLLSDLNYVLGFDRECDHNIFVICQYVGHYVFDFQESEIDIFSDDVQENLSDPAFSLPFLVEPLVEAGLISANSLLFGQTDEWSHAATITVDWKTKQETLLCELNGFYNFTTREWLVRPLLTYDIIDDLEISLGLDYYDGPDDTLFGLVNDEMSTVFIELKTYF